MEKITFSTELLEFLRTKSLKEVINKYEAYCFDKPYTAWVDDETYRIVGKDYFSLWFLKPGSIQSITKARNALVIRTCLRKAMKPNVTPDILLINIYIEANKYLTEFSKHWCITDYTRMVKKALRKPKETVEWYIDNCSCHNHFILNPALSDEKKHKLIPAIRKTVTDYYIGKYYDVTVSVAENLKILHDNDILIKQSRLYDWCKEYHIDTKEYKRVYKLKKVC